MFTSSILFTYSADKSYPAVRVLFLANGEGRKNEKDTATV